MTNLGRQTLQLVEIDMDRCSRTYGNAPCTAVLSASGFAYRDNNRQVPTNTKCWNTYFTCQDPDNFDREAYVLRFSRNQETGVAGLVYPCLQSVSTNPTEISLGRTDDRLGTFGKRARVQVKFTDFTDSDNLIDKYADERRDGTAQLPAVGYEPGDRGSFWTKLQARWPYYYGRELRVKEGYVGDDPSTMDTRTYIITEWKGPDANGNVTITAQDPLVLTDEDKAVAPIASSGKIDADIAAIGGTANFNLTPAGIGDSDYPASGYAAIGREIVAFTRTGDAISVTDRALGGSDLQAHSEGDTFQIALFYQNAKIYDVARELLRDYAGISDSFIPISDWTDEADTWFSGLALTRFIVKPTPVLQLMQELTKFGFDFWWDELGAEIRLRAQRPRNPTETVGSVSDDASIIEKTGGIRDLDDARLSQVYAWGGVIDYTDSLTDPSNYKRLEVFADLEAESANEYAQTRVAELYLSWLGNAGDNSAALAVCSRLLSRYRDTPKGIAFEVDIAKKGEVEIADFFDVTSRLSVDFDGSQVARTFQVTSVDEIDPGHRIRVQAQSFDYAGRFAFIMENSATSDYNSATDEEKASGAYIVDGGTLQFPDGSGPYEVF